MCTSKCKFMTQVEMPHHLSNLFLTMYVGVSFQSNRMQVNLGKIGNQIFDLYYNSWDERLRLLSKA